MKHKILLTILTSSAIITAGAQSATTQKQQISKLAGCFEVTFHYSETYAGDTAYKFHPLYNANGLKYVVAEEEDSNKLMLQHLLIVNDSTDIKHWREDWIQGHTALFRYNQQNEWVKTTYRGNRQHNVFGKGLSLLLSTGAMLL